MKKVLFLIRSLNVGGAERQLLTLLQAIDRNRFAPVLVTFYQDGTLLSEFTSHNIEVRSASKRDRWDVIPFLLRLIKIIRSEKPDLVVSYLVAANILAIFSKPLINSAKIVISIRYSYLRKADYDWLSSFLYFLEDKISFWSDLIIINSYTGAKMAAARGIPEKKMMVIPNGIDTEQFHPDTAARIESRQLFKIRPEDKVVGIIGRIDPTKDHATFLKAASIVIYQIPETYFLIVGSGEKQFELKQKALSESLGLSNNVIWISSQKDLLGVYNTLDVCVSSSLGEGFSNVISEAMACEIPCIVTDVGDSAQIVGDSGYVVPSGDEQEMAAAILKMLQLPQEPRRKLGKLAREKIISQFSVQKMVISSMDEFEKLGKI